MYVSAYLNIDSAFLVTMIHRCFFENALVLYTTGIVRPFFQHDMKYLITYRNIDLKSIKFET